jgi:hypothetical protein
MTTTTAAPRRQTQAIGAVGALALGAGLVLVLPASASAAETATGGDLSWGVKQSFRNYIGGPIAHGSVTTAGGATTASDGTYAFPAASGTVDGTSVEAAFTGSVFFSGHGGVLEVLVEDIRIDLDGTTGVLIADVTSRPFVSTTVPQPPVTYDDVALADLDLTGITPQVDGSEYSWSGIPATMTAAGAPAFAGFYGAGTALDPVSFSLTTGSTGPVDPEEPEEPTGDTATQEIEVVVPEGGTDPEPEPGSFSWQVDGASSAVDLGQAAPQDGRLVATGSIRPVVVTDTRTTGSAWSVTAQVSDFTSTAGTVAGKHLGWTPTAAGAGATAGPAVPSGITSGSGLAQTALLGSAPNGHAPGTATLGAVLNLQLPASTTAGTYSATLTLTALS